MRESWARVTPAERGIEPAESPGSEPARETSTVSAVAMSGPGLHLQSDRSLQRGVSGEASSASKQHGGEALGAAAQRPWWLQ